MKNYDDPHRMDYSNDGIDAWVHDDSADEFEHGERIFVPFIGREGVFVRREPKAWVVMLNGKEMGFRRISHMPILDRLADI